MSQVPDRNLVLFEVVPPRENERDVEAVQNMLASLAVEGAFSLELAGDQTSKHFLVRAPHSSAGHILNQLAGAYPQASFREVQPGQAGQDPGALGPDEWISSAELRLRRPAYLPIRTYISYREGSPKGADPVVDLLGALAGAGLTGRSLAQLILTPAPDDWSRDYLALARSRDWRERKASPRGQAAVAIFMGGVFLGLFLLLRGFFWWLEGLAGHALATLAILGGTELGLWRLLRLVGTEDDPDLIREKVMLPTFYVSIRLSGISQNPNHALERARRLVSAYRLFNLAGGNGFIAEAVTINPIQIDDQPRDHRLPIGYLSALLRRWRRTLLNIKELASLWHLPLGESEVQTLRRGLSRVVLPPAGTEDSGILVGHTEHQGRRVAVRLPREMLRQNVFLVGKTQRGKSNLMQILSEAAMEEPGRAVVVIDPHVDLVRNLLGRIPSHREKDVVLIDLFDRDFPVGINLLEYRPGSPVDRDKVVADIIDSFSDIWVQFWGPRMEIYLRWVLLTLAEFNRRAERQMTVVEVNLLLSHERFQADVLRHVTDPEIHRWWREEYEEQRRKHARFLMEVIAPVKTKIDRFVASSVARNVLGQPQSTVDLGKEIQSGKIILVNLASGLVGRETASLLGSAVLDVLASVFRYQAQDERSQRILATVVVDEIQAIDGAGRKYREFLQELSKFGANLILGTQSLGLLDVMDPGLKSAVFANCSTLFLFETSAEDARYLAGELDEAVSVPDLTNLGPYRCYVKTLAGKERTPVFSMQTVPAPSGLREIAERVQAGSRSSYARLRADVEAERTLEIQERYYPLRPDLVNVATRAPRPQPIDATQKGSPAPELGVAPVATGEGDRAPRHVVGPSPESKKDEEMPQKGRRRRSRGRKRRRGSLPEEHRTGDPALGDAVPAS